MRGLVKNILAYLILMCIYASYFMFFFYTLHVHQGQKYKKKKNKQKKLSWEYK